MAAGTGGHVIPGLAVAAEMRQRGWTRELARHAGRHGEPARARGAASRSTGSRSAACAARGWSATLLGALRLLGAFCACLRSRAAAADPTRWSAWAATSAFRAAGWPGCAASRCFSSTPTRRCCSATARCAGRAPHRVRLRRRIGAARWTTKAVVTGNPVRAEIEALRRPGAALRRPRRRAAAAGRRRQPRARRRSTNACRRRSR